MNQKPNPSLEHQLVQAKETIAELVAASHRRQQSDAVLAAMIETTDDPIAALDNERRILVVNSAMRMLFSRIYGAEPDVHDNILSYLPEERQHFWQRVFEETQAMGSRRFDQQYYLQNRRCDIEWSTSRIGSASGDTIGVVLVGRDITSRRVAEESLRERDTQLHHAQKMEAVGTWTGGVAHEFNNVLSIVLGNLELAAMDMASEHPVRDYVDDAKSGILRAKNVVRQLLEFSRKSDGQRQPVDLQSIATNALNLLRATTPAHIEFHQLINACPPVLADPAQIHQLLVNLCTNGAEAMDEDGGILTVTLESIRLKPGNIPDAVVLAPGDYAKLTVTDTGRGIDDAVAERIYEPFFSTKGPDRVTGLGLSVAQGIVKRHAGTIVAGNVPGRGAKFEVYFPVAVQPEAEAVPEPDPETLTGKERILFVDDEPKFVMITQRQLEYLGYRVTIFTNPVDALAHFKTAPDAVDLVISDVAMPKMTGDKLINQIRLIRPGMPAILCTGYRNKVDQKQAASMGCAYALKPVERNQLAHLVRTTLDSPAAVQTI
jgi:PAS domain S-box-containing protein